MEVRPEGRHLAESRNCFGQGFNEIIEFRFGVILAEAEKNISLGERFRQADGRKHGRNAHRFGDAGCASGDGDAFDIEHEREAFPFDELNRNVEIRGMPMLGILDGIGAVEAEVRNAILEAPENLDLQGTNMIGALRKIARGEFGGKAGPGDGGNIFRPSATAFLLVAALNERLQASAAMAVKHAHAFGSMRSAWTSMGSQPAAAIASTKIGMLRWDAMRESAWSGWIVPMSRFE